MARSWNPIGFTPLPVTIFTVLTYIALFAALLVTHHVVPSAPKTATPKGWDGVNITEAWLDLKTLSARFHPYNSKPNIETRAWLLERISEILDTNGVDWRVEIEASERNNHNKSLEHVFAESKPVVVFDDKRSNATYADWRRVNNTIDVNYFEADNVMVYIRGTEDDESDWWIKGSKHAGPGGVLVNAHYDSVSTGYGATDDGVGVVSILQLISHFSKEANRPKKGLLALLNNNEEDGLYGAYAFARHPMSKFPHTFLNLEGAGAGGRATLFRATDTEVTKFYSRSKYPFGSVVSGDGFKRGLVRSGTDYSVFTDELGMRGLDVAFMEPRARYHTSQDDARDTGIDSLWHMLSASLATVKGLTDDTSSTFQGPEDEDVPNRVNAGQGTTGVWFDVLGRTVAVLELNAMFGISVALLVAGPIFLIIMEVILRKSDKWYLLSGKKYLHSIDDDEPVKLFGLRGFFRFPLTFVAASAGVVALAYLLTKVNPYIVYSSEYAVYSMMLAAWPSISWFLLRLGDSLRPSALSRMYTLIWIYAISWMILVAVTIGENNLGLGSGYFLVIYNAAVFVALLISYFELFGLAKKSVYAEHAFYGPGGSDDHDRPISRDTADRPATRDGPEEVADGPEDADERSALLGGRQTFTRYGAHRRRSEDNEHEDILDSDPVFSKAYEGEQAWSSTLPQWTWILQFFILGPINIILVGQIALLLTSALHQTPADGSSVLTIYLLMAAISILLLLPLTPFLHRIKHQVPTILFLIFIGTLIYTIVAFPFSRSARLKVYFIQRLDLSTNESEVALIGLPTYIQDIVSSLPSAAENKDSLRCGAGIADWATRKGLETCIWNGLAPNVVPSNYKPLPLPEKKVPYPNTTYTAMWRGPSAVSPPDVSKWIEVNTTRHNSSGVVDIHIAALNSRACKIEFDAAVGNVSVVGSGPGEERYVRRNGEEGDVRRLKLFSREWDARFAVSVVPGAEEPQRDGRRDRDDGRHRHGVRSVDEGRQKLTGRVVCLWSDANQIGTIPALDEVKRFMPVWSIVSKQNDGLVEGFKRFEV